MPRPRVPDEKRQEEILAWVLRYFIKHRFSPLVIEVAEGLRTNRELVRHHLQVLEDKGVLTVGNGPRQIVVNYDALEVQKEFMSEEHQALVDEAARRLNVLLPGIPPERMAEIAEEVAKAVERHNSKES